MKEFTVHMNVDGKYIRRHFRTEFEKCTDGKWRLMCGVFLKESHSVEEFDSLEDGYDFVLKNPEYRFNFNEPEYEEDFLDKLEQELKEFLSRNQQQITAIGR